MIGCPLCHAERTELLLRCGACDYFSCLRCRLVFLDPARRPGPAEERARYETHENSPDDSAYRAFLWRLAGPMVGRLPPGASGLDYGSGPGPTLSVMLAERGFPMRDYDPFFVPDADALRRSYDFITCTETAEHFHRPGEELTRLASLLRPGGWLGIMTRMPEEEGPAPDWWYLSDPTHVCFYRPSTMRWIAEHRGWDLERPAPHVAIFRLSPGEPRRNGA